MSTIIHRPKAKEQIFFFLSGMIVGIPFPLLIDSLINRYLSQQIPFFYATLITAAIAAPVLEEFAKAFPLFYRHGETERSIVTLGFLTGLGFGIAEFILYVFFLHTPVLVRLPALLFHATNTSIVAYGISKNNAGKAFQFYLLAVSLHFLNNFSALYGNFWYIGGVGATLTSYILAWHFNRKTVEKTIDHWAQVIE